MKINSRILGLIVLVFIFGGIGVTMALNLWQTEGGRAPAKFRGGEAAGEYNPADIRGSQTFGELSKAFKIPLAEMGAAFGLGSTENLADTKITDLKTAYPGMGIGPDSVRSFVALYMGLPYELSDDARLPQPAVIILKARAALTEDQIALLDTRSVDVSGVKPVEGEAVTDGHEDSTERIVKGKTTFQEVLDWGVPGEEIEAVIGEKLPSTRMAIRDFVVKKEMEFRPVKEALQAKVDALGPP